MLHGNDSVGSKCVIDKRRRGNFKHGETLVEKKTFIERSTGIRKKKRSVRVLVKCTSPVCKTSTFIKKYKETAKGERWALGTKCNGYDIRDGYKNEKRTHTKVCSAFNVSELQHALLRFRKCFFMPFCLSAACCHLILFLYFFLFPTFFPTFFLCPFQGQNQPTFSATICASSSGRSGNNIHEATSNRAAKVLTVCIHRGT